MDRRSVFPGILLILLGIVFLLPNFMDVRVGDLWPVFLLGPGLAFFIMFTRDKKNYGLLMPATILTVMGLMFFGTTLRMTSMETIWPMFVIAPGLGLFLMYLLGKREKGLLVPAGILICVGLVFLIGVSEYSYLWPAVLIAIGIVLLLNAKR
jgi:hypothetical protein